MPDVPAAAVPAGVRLEPIGVVGDRQPAQRPDMRVGGTSTPVLHLAPARARQAQRRRPRERAELHLEPRHQSLGSGVPGANGVSARKTSTGPSRGSSLR